MEQNTIRYLHILADVWGKIYLFHPAVVQSDCVLNWEHVLLEAIPIVERARSIEHLAACLNETLFQPLHDPFSYAQCRTTPRETQGETFHATALPLQQKDTITRIHRVHEGWNERGRPYIYRQNWEIASGKPSNQPCRICYPEGLIVQLYTEMAWQDEKNLPSFGYAHRVCTTPSYEPLSREERLVGLFKTWTVLNYFFPLGHNTNTWWDELLSTWIPIIEADQDLKTYYQHMNAIAKLLHDGHAVAWHPVLLHQQQMKEQEPELCPNIPFPVPEAVKHIRKINDSLAFMNPFSMPNRQTLVEAFAMIHHTKGLILDLRGYPRTHFQQALIRCLCREAVPSPRYEIPVVSHPDVQRRQLLLVQYMVEPDSSRPIYDGSVVALVHGNTQSSAEDMCMYLRIARRATFVGIRTPGCHGNVAHIELPAGGWFAFSGMRVTWPDGKAFQSIGIIPDVEIDPASLSSEQDVILETGINVLTTFVE